MVQRPARPLLLHSDKSVLADSRLDVGELWEGVADGQWSATLSGKVTWEQTHLLGTEDAGELGSFPNPASEEMLSRTLEIVRATVPPMGLGLGVTIDADRSDTMVDRSE